MDKLLLLAKTVGEIKNQVKSLQNTPPEIHNFVGEKGDKGTDGKNGIDGKNGKDGLNGKDGKDGVSGEQGVSVVNANIELDGSLVLELSNGTEIDVGEVVGRDGANGINGLQGANGIGVPVGGATGQVLSKIDESDFNTQWITVNGGGGTETDPVFVASPAYGITATDLTNYSTAYGWGNHTSAGYLTSISSGMVTTALGFTPEPANANLAKYNDATASFTGNMQIDGNLTVSGATVTINASNLAVEDNMIYLNNGSVVSNPDLGIVGNYNDGTYRHAGIFRDATDGRWKIFKNYTLEPDASAYIDTAHASFALADFQANTFIGSLTGNADTVTSVTSTQVTNALGFTPYNATNPAGYLTSAAIGVSVQGYSTVLNNTTASFTTADETKLDGIAAGAEVNVNADWNAISGDALILNKPTLGTAAATNSTAYATAAQGTKADSALQAAAIGVTVQAYDADLTSWAAITPSTKQDTLVSATNIKTINGSSLLGSGDLVISGGGGSFTGGTLTSELILATGSASVTPLNFPAGTLNTTPVAGDMEFDGSVFYGTVGANNRGVIASEYFVVLQTNNTLTSQTAVQPLFDGGGTGLTAGALSLGTGTFFFECTYYLTSLSTSSGSFGFALGGTATKTYQYEAAGKKSALATAAAGSMTFNTGPNTTLVAASTTNTGYVKITGTVDITVAGTIIPQISLTVAAAAVVNTGSYFRIRRMGSSTVATMGNWS